MYMYKININHLLKILFRNVMAAIFFRAIKETTVLSDIHNRTINVFYMYMYTFTHEHVQV